MSNKLLSIKRILLTRSRQFKDRIDKGGEPWSDDGICENILGYPRRLQPAPLVDARELLYEYFIKWPECHKDSSGVTRAFPIDGVIDYFKGARWHGERRVRRLELLDFLIAELEQDLGCNHNTSSPTHFCIEQLELEQVKCLPKN